MKKDLWKSSIIANSEVSDFLKQSFDHFMFELIKFLDENDDPTVLGYCTEMTLFNLYISSIYRHYENVTAIQEYKVSLEKEKLGRPDAFIKFNRNAIWMESKFQEVAPLNEAHWDVQRWLKWDYDEIFSQLKRYYIADMKHMSTKTIYSSCSLVTVVFKLLKVDKENYVAEALSNLTVRTRDNENNRDWYYSLYFPKELSQLESAMNGIEIYGTINSKPWNIITS